MRKRKKRVNEQQIINSIINEPPKDITKKLIGAVLILTGFIFILNSFSGITGFAVAESVRKIPSSIIGIVLIVGGALVFLRGKESNLALEVKKSGAIITNPGKLKKIAHEMGYKGRKVKEGYQILDKDGKPLTVIPKHNIPPGV